MENGTIPPPPSSTCISLPPHTSCRCTAAAAGGRCAYLEGHGREGARGSRVDRAALPAAIWFGAQVVSRGGARCRGSFRQRRAEIWLAGGVGVGALEFGVRTWRRWVMPSSSPPRDPGAVVLLELLLPDPTSVAWVYSFERMGGSADAKADGVEGPWISTTLRIYFKFKLKT